MKKVVCILGQTKRYDWEPIELPSEGDYINLPNEMLVVTSICWNIEEKYVTIFCKIKKHNDFFDTTLKH